MDDIKFQEYIEKMNLWGKERKPFIFIFDFEMKHPIVLPLDEAAENGIYFTFDNLRNIDFHVITKREFTFRKFPVGFPVFKKSFDQIIHEIKLGNSFLANLTFPTPVETDLTLEEVFYRSEAPYKLLFRVCCLNRTVLKFR
jgi:para-aminobenzoate synthetase component I